MSRRNVWDADRGTEEIENKSMTIRDQIGIARPSGTLT